MINFIFSANKSWIFSTRQSLEEELHRFQLQALKKCSELNIFNSNFRKAFLYRIYKKKSKNL